MHVESYSEVDIASQVLVAVDFQDMKRIVKAGNARFKLLQINHQEYIDNLIHTCPS
jgi:hypothetical protein